MGYISGFRSGYSYRDKLAPSTEEARERRLALEAHIEKIGELGVNGAHEKGNSASVIDESYDGLADRRPDSEIAPVSPQEAIPALAAIQPNQPHLN